MEAKALNIFSVSKIHPPLPAFLYKDYRKLVVSVQDGRKVISFDDILYASSSSNYCTLVLKDRKITLSKTLKWVQEQLDETFLRVHNSYLVSLLQITSFTSKENALIINGTQVIPVSRSRKQELLNVLQ